VYLEAQSARIRQNFGRFLGKSPIVVASIQALALSKLDLSDCPDQTRLVAKILDRLSPRTLSPVSKQEEGN
jgi:hypothetical protein